ncbi:hypothetical protein BFW87_25680 [Pseudomonas fluorescens]|uniref:DUF4019 domain-containing protein n=1 Tax=Pseudomonas fluorescens TaxID=294 RepID=A0A1T2Y1Z1_PSEFL|nr:DUF4019 domain-containing protein [Pseudomonas fluorescens]OPA86141.1 hypothetical protein BFW87_25680 [Pseudomonas fluorescens]
MKQFTVLLFCVVLLTGCDISFNNGPPKVVTLTDPGTPQQQQQVFEAAGRFVHLLDDGKADETWALLSPVFKAKTSEFVWINSIKGLRMGLGTLKEHGSVSMGFTNEMPDAPAGRYAVVEFPSTFSTTSVKEKVILREDDSHWLIVGYFVNKSVVFGDQAKTKP